MLAQPRRTAWQRVRYLARRAWWMEVHGYQSFYRYVFRRPRVPNGATGFSYHQPVIALMLVFIGVSAVELVVVDLIVRRWPSVRLVLLVLGIWGLAFMVGLLLGMLTRPHAVGPDGLRLRQGPGVDIALPWADVSAVGRRRQVVQEKAPKVTVGPDGQATLHLWMQNETNLEVELEHPVRVRLPSGPETVSTIQFYADDPASFLEAVRPHLG